MQDGAVWDAATAAAAVAVDGIDGDDDGTVALVVVDVVAVSTVIENRPAMQMSSDCRSASVCS